MSRDRRLFTCFNCKGGMLYEIRNIAKVLVQLFNVAALEEASMF